MTRNKGRHYQLTHRASYSYPEQVTNSYGRAMLLPRHINGQRVHRAVLDVDPEPADSSERLDVAGNRTSFFHVTAPHRVLEVSARSLITVTRRRPDLGSLPALGWSEAVSAVSSMRATGRGGQGEGPAAVMAVVEGVLPSEYSVPSEAVLDYALTCFLGGVGLTEAFMSLAHRIWEDLHYRPSTGHGGTTLESVLEHRAGSAADFAHLMCACLRAVGLSSRFVSGYVHSDNAREVQVPHAWVAVWVPGGGWVHVDPVRNQLVDQHYVMVAWGRDLADVVPLRGVAYSVEDAATLTVDVQLTRLTAEEIDHLLASEPPPPAHAATLPE